MERRIDDARARLVALEADASRPDLWDDPDKARLVNTEMARVREDVKGDPRLVAYVVPVAGGSIPIEELKQAVAGTLPLHMHPSAYVVLDALPLTPNRKVDRAALRKIAQQRVATAP